MIKLEDRIKILWNLTELLKKNKIDNQDKEKIYNVVINMTYGTKVQRDRFVKYFGLKPKKFKRQKLREIAEVENCSTEAIRRSIYRTRSCLHSISENEFSTLLEIYKKYNN